MKDGVGKTSVACAAATGLANRVKRVQLDSTDPTSNLDEMLSTKLGNTPMAVLGVPALSAMNIDLEQAAEEYLTRVLAKLGPEADANGSA